MQIVKSTVIAIILTIFVPNLVIASETNSPYTPEIKLIKRIQNLMLEKIQQHEKMSQEEIVDDIVATAMMNPEYLQRFYGASATFLNADLMILTKEDILFIEKRRLEQVALCENYFFMFTRAVDFKQGAKHTWDLSSQEPLKYAWWLPLAFSIESLGVLAIDTVAFPGYLLATINSCFAD